MDLAVYSVFGEYQKELEKEYHIFGMDAGYETGSYSEESILGRLRYYGAENLEHEITDIQFLTDNQGAAFYEQVLYYMETKYGISLVREFTGATGKWTEQMIQGEEYCEEKEASLDSFVRAADNIPVADNMPAEDGQAEPGHPEGNQDAVYEAEGALDSLKAMQEGESSAFLEKVLPNDFVLSYQAVSLEELPSRRALNRGYGSFQQAELKGVTQKLLFDEYLLQNFSNALEAEEGGGFAYEIEYVIGGKSSDRENLETVAKRLAILRFAADYAYLLTDEGRKAEAETAAFTICTILLLPELAEAAKHVILLLWAYKEGMQDVRNLLAGQKVPLLKTNDNWQLPLRSVLGLNGGDGNLTLSQGSGEGGSGLAYQDYLRILLFLMNREDTAMRGLDVIEAALRQRKGLSFFRVDYCVAKIRLESTAVLRQGITYEFPTEFYYR